ncbi:MAG: FtsX-like permease family protein [Saprospiraceae bacterium]
MKPQPPKKALQFLRWFCRPDYLEEIEGDLLELYEQDLEQPSWHANWRFTWQVLRHFRPDFIKPLTKNPIIHPAMLRHNFLITWRGFMRSKSTFLINLIGLSTGLACVLLIFLWVTDEVRMDKFHEKDSRLYQVMFNMEFSQGISTEETTPVPLATSLIEDMPEVEYTVAVNNFFNWHSREGIFSMGDKRVAASGLIAGEDFFRIFSYPLIQGDPEQILSDENSVIISESLALKLFATTENIVGKALEWEHPGFDNLFRISGVFADPPAHSTEQFDFVMPLAQLIENDRYSNDWKGCYAKVYLTLQEGTDPAAFNDKLDGYLEKKDPVLDECSIFIQPYSEKYLYGRYESGKPVEGRKAYVKLFSLVALFLLFIACINFMNLSTAQASKKMKEIGVKKTLGANRKALAGQFLGESMIMVFLSLCLALFLVALLLPQFNAFTGKQLQTNVDGKLFLFILGIVVLTGLLAGSYPAFYLSGFSPLSVMKGKLKASMGEFWIRKGLVVFQFSLSLLFIAGLLVIHQQIKLTQTKNLGYDRDNVLSFNWKGDLYESWQLREDTSRSNERFYTFIDGLANIPGVISASNMQGNILDEVMGQSGITWSGKEEEREFLFRSPVVGYGLIETLGIELSAGRTFSKEHGDGYRKIVINEAAVKKMGLEDPVGAVIQMNGGSEIIGVVKDFHYGSLYNGIEPLIFRCDPDGGNILVRIAAGTEQATIASLETYLNELLPGHSFEYSFLDEAYQKQYEAERKVSVLSRYFAGLAIIISCLGLFGLATFTTERRQKEIGIRKVLGAGVFSIVRMLSGDFSRSILAAIVISLPIGYLAAKSWLANYVYSIDLQWWYFVLPAAVVLLLSWFTVGMQTVKAARINPIQCLKDE